MYLILLPKLNCGPAATSPSRSYRFERPIWLQCLPKPVDGSLLVIELFSPSHFNHLQSPAIMVPIRLVNQNLLCAFPFSTLPVVVPHFSVSASLRVVLAEDDLSCYVWTFSASDVFAWAHLEERFNFCVRRSLLEDVWSWEMLLTFNFQSSA